MVVEVGRGVVVVRYDCKSARCVFFSLKVKMKPRPWHRRWERYELKGLDVSGVSQSRMATVQDHILPEYKKMDLLMMYPRYDITEKDRMRIEREWEVHQNELERTAKKGR